MSSRVGSAARERARKLSSETRHQFYHSLSINGTRGHLCADISTVKIRWATCVLLAQRKSVAHAPALVASTASRRQTKTYTA